MSPLNKIFISTLTLCYAALASACVYGQDISLHKKHRPVTIGFQTGRELLFNSSPLLHSRQSKVHYGVSSSLVLRKPLNTHFKLETGIKYSAIPNAIKIKISTNKDFNSNTYKQYKQVAAPFTIQYYFLRPQVRVRPSLGAGLQYNYTINGSDFPPFNSNLQPENSAPSGTKYISVLFTEGITFQINTKIQLTQSFHFIPGNTDKSIGLDFGIDYNIQ